MADDVLFTRENQVGIITLNRSQALNALTLPMILALQEQLLAWQHDKTIHAVVVCAAPGKAFCAGGDVRWLYEQGRQYDPQQMQFFFHEYRLNHFIHHFSKPYIAYMNGITMGGGVGISLHGSHPIASEQFVFAMPETTIGFFPDIGASHLLSRCPGQFGMYLGLTGNRLNASEAYELGLVKQVIASEQWEAAFHHLLATDLSVAPHETVNACLQRFATPVSSAPVLELAACINHAFGQNNVESILDALKEGEDNWHREILAVLQQKSPLSLKITHKQIRKAKGMTMAECVKMDYCLVRHFMQAQDFYEGVRALLVDKDKSPRWQPPTLADVNERMVEQYFKDGEELPLLSLI
ncbi:enoyl-CoA hydratase/isomerase family protein [Legionella oakridgensis]|uniref:enoyl-CoA hydratase/isomerase family protein n=1 Tax=Legionella oakridgensis TaxID=29423 RepID=UPI0003DDF7C1|nr:enoyl-CoA hydratase/isomerase family protein [Legionella oakridgensis]ETO93526.1 enoyl-CoA hydratase/carnithine racemase [Legionella oakridgensis RV-2-2007]